MYSPKNSSFLKGIVGTIQKDFKSQNVTFELLELDNAETLDEYLGAYNPFVGIEFDDDLIVSSC